MTSWSMSWPDRLMNSMPNWLARAFRTSVLLATLLLGQDVDHALVGGLRLRQRIGALLVGDEADTLQDLDYVFVVSCHSATWGLKAGRRCSTELP
jgi:hypothetical protein